MEETDQSIRINQTNENIDFQDAWETFTAYKYWFIASFLICMAVAVLYFFSTPGVYIRSASILIKNDAKGNNAGKTYSNNFNDLSLFKAKVNISNEILTISSPTMMTEVVARLGLYETFTVCQGLKHIELYKAAPCTVTYLHPEDEPLQFTLKFIDNSHYILEDFSTLVNGESVTMSYKGVLGDTLQTIAGPLVLTSTQYFTPESVQQKFLYNKERLLTTTNEYSSRLFVELSKKDANVIDIMIDDASPKKAEDILNTLISVYNEYWILDNNQIAISTSQFIDERLCKIEEELGDVDNDISTYKSENLLPDVEAVSQLYLNQSAEYKKSIQDLTNQLNIALYIHNKLSKKNYLESIPANLGIKNELIQQQISEYNHFVLNYDRLKSNSGEKNPLVIDLMASLNGLKKAILLSLENLQKSLNIQIHSLRQESVINERQLQSSPDQAKFITSVERKQKVKSALYLYLLQKREECQLSQAFTAYNTRVITPPRGRLEPIAPRLSNILILATIIAFVIPTLFVFVYKKMDNKLRRRKDVAKLDIPIIGEIPFVHKLRRRSGFSKKDESIFFIVEEEKTDRLNESFRVLRSNLELVCNHTKKCQVLMATSFNPGSGKSFLTANIGMSLLLQGKKVLLIDGDLRHASLSTIVNSPKKGLSDYLNNSITHWNQLIVSPKVFPLLHIVPAGIVRPNPSELLEREQLSNLIEEAKNVYDYIIIDCPPTDIVADAQIIAPLADRTLFVLRIGLLDRTLLSELYKKYVEKRFNGLSIILNGCDNSYQ